MFKNIFPGGQPVPGSDDKNLEENIVQDGLSKNIQIQFFITEVNPDRLGWSSTLSVYHFVDPDLGVEKVFDKKGTAEKDVVNFEIED